MNERELQMTVDDTLSRANTALRMAAELAPLPDLPHASSGADRLKLPRLVTLGVLAALVGGGFLVAHTTYVKSPRISPYAGQSLPASETSILRTPEPTATSMQGACVATPLTPPTLSDGSAPTDLRVTPTTGSESIAEWGDPTRNAVRQFLGAPVSDDLIDSARGTANFLASARHEIAIVPVGDPPTGTILLDVLDTEDGCLRRYSVGPGLELAEALSLGESWLKLLA